MGAGVGVGGSRFESWLGSSSRVFRFPSGVEVLLFLRARFAHTRTSRGDESSHTSFFSLGFRFGFLSQLYTQVFFRLVFGFIHVFSALSFFRIRFERKREREREGGEKGVKTRPV